MKILLLSIGSRGDIEPFLAIGEILRGHGHDVLCAFPQQFKQITIESGFEFESLGLEFLNLLDGDDAKVALGGGGSWLNKVIAYSRLSLKSTSVNKDLIRRQYEIVSRCGPDRIVYNGKAIYPLLWTATQQGKAILISPVPYLHSVNDHSHIAFGKDLGKFLNRLSYKLADVGMLVTAKISAKWLKLMGASFKKIREAYYSNPAIYTISPSLFKRPVDLENQIKVLGFHERDKGINWKADDALLDFMQKHEKIVFVTFGSMTNPSPKEKTSLILNLLEKNKISAIINTSQGGLREPEQYDDELFHFVSDIPYDWVFPKVYGVIHHGGSGTTHMALKYGCANMVLPHIIDQFVWDKIVAEVGAGPKGIPIGKLNKEGLEPKVVDLVNNPSYKMNAVRIAEQMEYEDFSEELCSVIEQG